MIRTEFEELTWEDISDVNFLNEVVAKLLVFPSSHSACTLAYVFSQTLSNSKDGWVAVSFTGYVLFFCI